ncbi:hypothetical protein J6590_021262 [Homalodisca vitripennis]|nr:hypothetical protein J6590_021262 [Homalodisca vitripennis]
MFKSGGVRPVDVLGQQFNLKSQSSTSSQSSRNGVTATYYSQDVGSLKIIPNRWFNMASSEAGCNETTWGFPN